MHLTRKETRDCLGKEENSRRATRKAVKDKKDESGQVYDELERKHH